MFAAAGRRPPFTFWSKVVAALALVVLADRLFLFHEVGVSLGIFALSWLVLTATTRRALWRDRRAWAALAAAALYAASLLDHASLLAWVLFCVALGTASLLPGAVFGDVWRWTQRLIVLGIAGLLGPVLDLRRLRKAGGLPPLKGALRLVPILALPIAGGAVFLFLFASANPLISEALDQLRLPPLSFRTVIRTLLLTVIFVVVWGSLRPRRLRKPLPLPEGRTGSLPGFGAPSVTLSLLVFNLLFALQNGLDAAFLWSGAPLPEGVTLAEYAHRGAYPLIATALLAGLFVLVALSPGSETARRPWIRRLVVFWVVQNLFLVASTMLRTADYIAVYSLTQLRIAALAWMMLVGVGLILICWRMLRGRSAAWLLNANATAAGLVLTASVLVDFGALAADWNVVHGRESGGRGAEIDLCYLNGLNGSALPALSRLEARTPEGAFRDRVSFVRWQVQSRLNGQQSEWRAWTWRGARQMAQARRIQRHSGVPAGPPANEDRRCDGSVSPPPPPPPPPPASFSQQPILPRTVPPSPALTPPVQP